MALQHTPLDPSSLGSSAQQALSGGPARMMAARGMAPLSDPRDLVSVLYQLGLDAEASIKQAAQASADSLPENVLKAALADPALDPRVIDYFAARVKGNAPLIATVALNSATAVETLSDLARTGSAALVDLLAQNEERLLRSPQIIAAMYKNPSARMSTVDRVVELAVRSQVKVDIPAWEEVCSALAGKAAQPADAQPANADELFAAAASRVAEHDGKDASSTDLKDVPINQMTIPMKIRLAILGNRFARAQLIRDRASVVAMAAIKSPAVTDSEAAKYAGNSAIADDVITYIANRRDWTKLYSIKLSLVMNPKTPIPKAMSFMNFMRDKDLRNISRSKGIPSAVAAQARKLINQRSTRGKR